MSNAQIINFPSSSHPVEVAPKWVTNRTERRYFANWAKSHAAQVGAYHAARTPLYAGRLAVFAPIGLGRTVLGAAKWAADWESREMRQAVIHSHDANLAGKFASVEKLHSERVKFRAYSLGVGASVVAGSALALGLWGTGLEQTVASVGSVAGFGFLGRPRDRQIIKTAIVRNEAQRLTADFVNAALCNLGIARMNDPEQMPTPLVVRDGRGWRAEVDLPAGITASDVMDRRERLAAALSRPLGAVWPEGDSTTSPGRLVLWVGDHDHASLPQPLWPLVNTKSLDLFDPFAFGENAKGDKITLTLAETNMLIGAIPGAGKTTALRAALLPAILDPRTELWVYEFKGTGDFDALAPVATRFGSGPDDDTIKSALEALRALRRECSKRAEIIKRLGNKAAEHKVTSELANYHGLHPLVVAIDEAQELFRNSACGKEAGELAEQIIKLGRALGVILLIATQRPDRDSLPTGISANVGTRFCLRVVGHIENDMILGTSSHKNGTKATLFTKRDRGMGYLVGQHDEAQIVRVYNIDTETIDATVAKALALRAGRLSTEATPESELTEESTDSILDRIVAQAGDVDRIWLSDLAEMLSIEPSVLRWELKAAGIEIRQILKTVAGKPTNKRGINVDDVRNAREVN